MTADMISHSQRSEEEQAPNRSENITQVARRNCSRIAARDCVNQETWPNGAWWKLPIVVMRAFCKRKRGSNVRRRFNFRGAGDSGECQGKAQHPPAALRSPINASMRTNKVTIVCKRLSVPR